MPADHGLRPDDLQRLKIVETRLNFDLTAQDGPRLVEDETGRNCGQHAGAPIDITMPIAVETPLPAATGQIPVQLTLLGLPITHVPALLLQGFQLLCRREVMLGFLFQRAFDGIDGYQGRSGRRGR